MKQNKQVRVCEKFWIEKANSTLDYKLIGLSWHTTISAAKRYYSKHHEFQKQELEVRDLAVDVCYTPLFPRLAKKS